MATGLNTSDEQSGSPRSTTLVDCRLGVVCRSGKRHARLVLSQKWCEACGELGWPADHRGVVAASACDRPRLTPILSAIWSSAVPASFWSSSMSTTPGPRPARAGQAAARGRRSGRAPPGATRRARGRSVHRRWWRTLMPVRRRGPRSRPGRRWLLEVRCDDWRLRDERVRTTMCSAYLFRRTTSHLQLEGSGASREADTRGGSGVACRDRLLWPTSGLGGGDSLGSLTSHRS
jgi:hypothetical protein